MKKKTRSFGPAFVSGGNLFGGGPHKFSEIPDGQAPSATVTDMQKAVKTSRQQQTEH